jgi:hypothetical protein
VIHMEQRGGISYSPDPQHSRCVDGYGNGPLHLCSRLFEGWNDWITTDPENVTCDLCLAKLPIKTLVTVMFHDDSCGEYLEDSGLCPRCRFHPDMQSTGFIDISREIFDSFKSQGHTFLGLRRTKL